MPCDGFSVVMTLEFRFKMIFGKIAALVLVCVFAFLMLLCYIDAIEKSYCTVLLFSSDILSI